jgi:hypothetical protein
VADMTHTDSEILFDNGRIRMEEYRGVLYCDAYMEDEFTNDDVQTIIDEIIRSFGGKADIILKKTGRYSVSSEAQIRLTWGVKEFRNFVYVVDTQIKKNSAGYAASTYMAGYNTKVCESREEAYSLLTQLTVEHSRYTEM